MKKILLSSLLLFLMFISTGCVKLDYDIEVGSDEKVKLSETQNIAFSKTLPEDFHTILSSNIANYTASYVEKGYKVASSNDSEGVNINLTKDNIDFVKVGEYLPSGFERNNSESFVVKRGLITNNYQIHLVYNVKNITPDSLENRKYFNTALGLLDEDLGKIVLLTTSSVDPATGGLLVKTNYLNGTVDINSFFPNQTAETVVYEPTLRIKIPAKPTRHNATRVLIGNVYEWNLSGNGLPIDIYIEYQRLNIVAIAVILSVITMIVFVFMVSAKLNENQPVEGL